MSLPSVVIALALGCLAGAPLGVLASAETPSAVPAAPDTPALAPPDPTMTPGAVTRR